MENTEMQEVVKLAVDTYHNRVEKYSAQDSIKTLRNALIEANNGKTHIDYRDIRDGKCREVFAITEQILAQTVVEGLQGDEYFMALVDFRNLAAGDSEKFLIEDRDLFVVAKAADGTQGIRRQRIGGMSEKTIETSFRVVKVYEELNRVLAGRVDFNDMINKVSESFRKQLLDDIYTLWKGATADQIGGTTYFPTAGAYSEDALLDLISHVEASANSQQATIIGTRKGIRNLVPSIQGDVFKDDMYNLGYCGKFYGTPVVVTPQRHKVGSTDFVLDDNVITVVAGGDKPIKVVYEGNPLVIPGDPLSNADLAQTFLYGEKYGVGLVLSGGNSGIGRYEMTGV